MLNCDCHISSRHLESVAYGIYIATVQKKIPPPFGGGQQPKWRAQWRRPTSSRPRRAEPTWGKENLLEANSAQKRGEIRGAANFSWGGNLGKRYHCALQGTGRRGSTGRPPSPEGRRPHPPLRRRTAPPPLRHNGKQK